MNLALRLSKKALTPSALSFVAILAINKLLSWSIAALSPTSKAFFTALFVNAAAIYDFDAIFFANVNAVSASLS